MWFIFGMLVLLQVWDIESSAEYNFKGLVRQVNPLEAINDLLFFLG